MTRTRWFPLALAVLFAALGSERSSYGQCATRMCWSSAAEDLIKCRDIDGTDIETLPITVTNPNRLAFDGVSKLYFTNCEDGGTSGVRRANLDGSDVELLVDGGYCPHGIALDVANGKMYWAETGSTDALMRANLDGSDDGKIYTDVDEANGLFLDSANDRIYWTSHPLNKLHYAPMFPPYDDENIGELLYTDLIKPHALDVDVASNMIYWAEHTVAPGRIRSGVIGDGGAGTLVYEPTDPIGIKLDLCLGKIYWCDFAGGRIMRAELNGDNPEELVTGLTQPNWIELITPTTCGDGLIGWDEECDDGDINNDDGCSATCTVEPDSICAGEPSDCTTGIPAVSTWGLGVMLLLLLSAGTLVMTRRKQAA